MDASGYATTWNGTTWAAATDIDTTHALEAVSCTSSSFCKAVDNDGNVLTWTGTWSAATSIDSTRAIDAISCPTTSFCAAVDASGYATTWNGTTWAAATDIDGSHALEVGVVHQFELLQGGRQRRQRAHLDRHLVGGDLDRLHPGHRRHQLPDRQLLRRGGRLGLRHHLERHHLGRGHRHRRRPRPGVGVVHQLRPAAWPPTTTATCSPTTAPPGRRLPTSTPPGYWTRVSCATASFCAAVDTSGYGLVYQADYRLSPSSPGRATGSLALILSDSYFDYIYGPSATPVEQVSLTTSVPTYMTYIPADSTWVTTNTAGDETGFWGYDAFGNLAFGSPASAFGYAGQYTDATTGLSDMRARWYEPGTGAFSTRDADFAATDTAYTYAGDDPVNEGDPTGDSPLCLTGPSSVASAWGAFQAPTATLLGRPGAQLTVARRFVSNLTETTPTGCAPGESCAAEVAYGDASGDSRYVINAQVSGVGPASGSVSTLELVP